MYLLVNIGSLLIVSLLIVDVFIYVYILSNL